MWFGTYKKAFRLPQLPAVFRDERLLLLPYAVPLRFVNIHTLIRYGFIGLPHEPYILPAVTVGLRLHLLSPTAGDLGQPLRGQFQFSLPLLHTGQQLSERQGNCTTPHLCISLYHGIKDIKKVFLCQA